MTSNPVIWMSAFVVAVIVVVVLIELDARRGNATFGKAASIIYAVVAAWLAANIIRFLWNGLYDVPVL